VIQAGQASRDAERQAEREGGSAGGHYGPQDEPFADEKEPPIRPTGPRGARARY
jgi:hypothetical protein